MNESRTATPTNGQVVVTGSAAFDNIMDFPGKFEDHILADKLHVINISFLVEKLERQRGGCAPNIAYTLALLGHRPRVVAAVGHDFAEYRQWLDDEGVDTEGLATHGDEMTATCYITSDRNNCQITGFYVGAMKRAGEISLTEASGERAALAIIAPDDPDAMVRHCAEARAEGLPFLFDPSFQVTAMEGETLASAAAGAKALVVNDYEFSVYGDKTGKTPDEIRADHELVIVTLGKKGSEILLQEGGSIDIPPAKVTDVVDPTGAGDAFRGGFAAGLMEGRDLATSGRMGSVAAAAAIEKYGTQNHRYTREEFEALYLDSFASGLG